MWWRRARIATALGVAVALGACSGDGASSVPTGAAAGGPATAPARSSGPSTAPSGGPSTVPAGGASTAPAGGGSAAPDGSSGGPTTGAGSTAPAASAPGGGVVPSGFETVAAEAVTADGEVCALCLWVAATGEQRGRGLMGVTDLGPADGMVFLFDAPTSSRFWMRDTPLPLSIAFFEGGAFVSATDMVPCLDGPPEACPRYRADGPYDTAVEVPAGRLEELGLTPGSRLTLLDTPCPPPP